MLTKFRHIKNFAVFKECDWDTSIRDKGNNIAILKKLNIIYGRNYSGKTSLSRIIRSLETGVKHPKYLDSSYEFSHTNGGSLSDKNLSACPYTVRVYNKDFLDENLKWLSNPDGSIKPFTILGEKNIEIENEIAKNEKMLGSIKEKIGLHWDSFCKASEHRELEDKVQRKKRELDDKLREKANTDIKQNPIYRNINYNIGTIKSDIATIGIDKTSILSAEQKSELTLSLTEESKDIIDFQLSIDNKLPIYRNAAADLLGRTINPTHITQELLEDPLLEEWVRNGLAHHKHKENCQFCGNTLTAQVWEKLNGHFNKDSENLRDLIDNLIVSIRDEQKRAREFSLPNDAGFYSSLQEKFRDIKSRLTEEVKQYIAALGILITELESRKSDIYKSRCLPDIRQDYKISATIQEIKGVVKAHNFKTSSLSSDQDQARRILRLSEVATFTRDIDYSNKSHEIDRLSGELRQLKIAIEKLNEKSAETLGKISELHNQLQDEHKGAELVNHYLKNHFGHEALQLNATESIDSKVITFSITRNGELAYNLSEGECSLVAFCYFIAKLQDTNTVGKELIIWIDDPISSLDSNHIYFIFSLIENAIAKPIKDPTTSVTTYRYSQLFISTHNLDFLKYLKRISKPKNDNEFFTLERGAESSKIKLMPSYLKRFVTEFNYLFSQIHKCANPHAELEDHDAFYNFGNNLRKFLEAYLFYKYPNNKSNDEKLLLFFGGNDLHTDLTNRVNNELSHLEEIFDRSMRPIEVPEIPKLAKFVLETIQQKDPDQYSALLESIRDT
jgi:wobble nucleotide-excising tRNase